MSSRALRKLQKQQESAQKIEQEEISDDSEEEVTRAPTKFNAFDLLNEQDAEHESESEASVIEQEVIAPAPVSVPAESPKPTAGSKKSKKKKKKRGKKQEAAPQAKSSPSPDDESELDEIDRALQDLSVKQPTRTRDEATSADASNAELQASLDALLSIDSKRLNALNEMKKLFGNIIMENRREEGARQAPGRRRDRNRQGIDLGRALTGRFSPASRGQDLAGAALRKNILMQAKDEWPKATSGGLGMEIVEKKSSGQTVFKLVHNAAYKDVQRQFDICVESMEPERMIQLLQYNPYHLSTLLQVSEIAKHQGDHAVSGDLLERALFNIGRSVNSSFANQLKDGTARMDFEVKANREFWLAGWKYIVNLGMKGTWQTAYEWAKLLLSIDPEDPYAITLILDQLAIRGREYGHFIEICQHDFFKTRWQVYPNIQCSLPLAYFRQGNASESRRLLSEAMKKYPWIFCRLAQELNINPIPKHIWGKQAPTQSHELLSELYVVRAKDNWNTPETISLLVEVADTITASETAIEPPEISLDIARHVILSDVRAVTTHLPRSFVGGRISASDPLPPGQPVGEVPPAYSQYMFEAANQIFGLNQRAVDQDPESLLEEADIDDVDTVDRPETSDEEIMASHPEGYLFTNGLRDLRTFIHENGVDRGNWEPNVDSSPVTDWIGRLTQLEPDRWHPVIHDAAIELNSPLVLDLLLEELRMQTEE
ncbi:hypothetical protein AJ80_00786 [Polytolypa hystricis UAMH7299]|uniref:Nulp1-pending protein n=1 Tax=Polytolypa hystricis (strain UAMH7299) TaxID=1447883 RepID=A0A2B7Z1R8_POLH7|nr:hypothetical protein AJ80_00786 [Polytolypa hystricis UAMH7299]